MKKIVFTFGRYNPPTSGHAELITYAVKLAQRTGAEHRIYTSQSHDPSKNPLAPRQKMAFLRQIFPGVNFIDDPAMKTAFIICRKLADEGYEEVTFVVGDDRVSEFKTSFSRYVKPKTAKDYNPKIHYPFKKFQVVSSGARKQGISGTDLRAAVRKGDFATFAKASAAKDRTLAKKIFDATRAQLKEDVNITEVTAREMHKHLTSKGWSLERKGKSHDLYSHPQSKGRRITLPRHPGELDRRLQKEIDKQTERYIREEKGMSRKDFHENLMSFVDFTCDKLGIKEKPSIRYKDPDEQGEQPSFAAYSPGQKEVIIMTKNRHPMDVFRSIAHELVHHKQNEDGRLGKDIAAEGSTGSDIENEANSEAGKVMRYFGKENPFYFDMSYVTEQKAIILAGTPGSGKDKILKETILPHGYQEISSENFHNLKFDGNVVVNGTSDYNKISAIKEALELRGYQTVMVFVNTSDEVSKQRNEARATKGGRVINETVRFAKWKGAQDNLNRFDHLFEKVIEVKNDLDANVIKEVYDKLMDAVSKEIEQFTLNEMDKRFEKMLNEMDTDLMPSSKNIIDKRNDNSSNPKDDTVYTKDWRRNNVTTPSPEDRFGAKTPENTTPKVDTQRGAYGATPEVKGTISTFRGVNRTPLLEVGGAGNWGTQKLTDRYKKDTPGQEPGKFAKMKVLKLKNKMKTEDKGRSLYPSLPIGGDRIGPEAGLPKSPGFGDNQTMDITGLDRQIDRWMVKEETRKRFTEKYGKLAEQKLKEAAMKASKACAESLTDPYTGGMSDVSTTGGPGESNIQPSGVEQEKTSLFGKKISKRLNSK